MKRGFSFALMEESLQWGQSAFLESLDGIEPDQIEAGIGTLQRADGNATIKGPGDYFSLKDSLGRTANNIGLFRPSRNGVELPRGEWSLAEKLFAEGEHFSQLVNQIPGMNSFSLVHDAYAVSSGQAITSLFGDNGFSSFLQGVNNVITIPPMAAAHYSAMGYTDRLNRDRAYVGR
ncbi:hypothetical protein MRY87_12150 [bacterium]|nr:hypothetical protein [bacterium]